MLTRTRRSVMLLLVAVSVVGVLAMHGLDPVVATVDQTHSSHSSDTDSGVDDHAAIGLCVFVAAVATLGLAAIKRHQSAETLANLAYRPGQFTRTQPVATSGPPLLYRLCVLRI
jgi:hypothetical protein